MLNLSGTIKCTTKFVPNCAIVELDQPYQGRKYTVINRETVGRVALLMRLGGEMKVGAAVVIENAKIGSEALLATEVK